MKMMMPKLNGTISNQTIKFTKQRLKEVKSMKKMKIITKRMKGKIMKRIRKSNVMMKENSLPIIIQ